MVLLWGSSGVLFIFRFSVLVGGMSSWVVVGFGVFLYLGNCNF